MCFVTWAVLTAAPYPVGTPQPRRQALSSGKSWGICINKQTKRGVDVEVGHFLFRYKWGVQIVGIIDRLSSPFLFLTSSLFNFFFKFFFLPTQHFAPLSTGCKIILRRTNYGLQWRTKILGTVMKNLPSTSLTYQMFRCSIICTSLTTWMPRLSLPYPLQTMLGWRNTFRTG